MRRFAFAALLAACHAASAFEAGPPDSTHYHQFGLGVTAGSGYIIRFKYGSADSCGEPGKNSCYYRLPTWLDLKAFFGVAQSVDLVVEQRFGLETDFTDTHNFLLMPGIRVYPDAHKPFKFFVQIQLAIDFTDWKGHAPSSVDFGLHEVNGFQWDFLRYMGAYFQISETFEFIRSLTFQIEAGLGVEGRFP
jgi:hypothetical protein